jgi:hypothetical protein
MHINGDAFAYRHNRNGSYDAICLSCLLTIGNRSTEEGLKEDEAAHRCRPEDVLFGHSRSKPTPMRPLRDHAV